MNKVKILCDSVADIFEVDNKNGLELFDIDYVPLYVRFDGELFKDFKEINSKKLFKKVEKLGYLPKTSCPSPDDYFQLINKYVNDGYDVVFFSIGKELSGGYKSCQLGIDEIESGRVFIIDSENLSSGIGIQIIKACKLRDEGKSAKEIYEYAEANKKKSKCKFVVDTMEYLHKGGRCSSIAALFGNIIQLKPVITVEDGKMRVYQKPIGKRRAFNALLDDFKEDYDANNIDLDYVLITHSEAYDDVDFLRDGLIEIGVDPSIIHTSNANCTVSTHCGPGCIGIIYNTK